MPFTMGYTRRSDFEVAVDPPQLDLPARHEAEQQGDLHPGKMRLLLEDHRLYGPGFPGLLEFADEPRSNHRTEAVLSVNV